jgi:hypothetical protein
MKIYSTPGIHGLIINTRRTAIEAALHVCDPLFALQWPLKVARLSELATRHHLITDAFTGIEL